jgi:hypothetical protein
MRGLHGATRRFYTMQRGDSTEPRARPKVVTAGRLRSAIAAGDCSITEAVISRC